MTPILLIGKNKRWLHLTGDRIGASFDRFCETNSYIMRLFGPDWKFHIYLKDKKLVKDFGILLGNNVLINLTQISDAGHIFRFQSIHHTQNDSKKKLIFESGASISITPDKGDSVKFTFNVGETNLTGITLTTICKGKSIIKLYLFILTVLAMFIL